MIFKLTNSSFRTNNHAVATSEKSQKNSVTFNQKQKQRVMELKLNFSNFQFVILISVQLFLSCV